ncbi:olfactory receptor 5AP2-like [Mantella aurantiaca]
MTYQSGFLFSREKKMFNVSVPTAIAGFILTGLTDNADLRIHVFLLLLVFYIVSVLGNAGIILAILLDHELYTPMYLFVSHLSIVDLFYTSVVTPNTLANFNSRIKSITFIGCATQLFLFGGSATTESYLLAVMAYDRLVAIRYPLLYMNIMSQTTCSLLVTMAYFSGYFNSLIQTYFTFRLSYCASNIIDHFYCDIPPLIKLSCSDTYINEVVIFIFAGVTSVICLPTILYSYVNILVTILGMQSAKGRNKAYSTCGSHLMCVSIFYGTVMFTYLRPSSDHSLNNDKIISVFYAVVIPMLNPMIYSLRNTEVKLAMRKIVIKYIIFYIRKPHL